MQDILELPPQPVLTGYSRFVYPHPHNPEWWVKVMRPDILADYRRGEVPWYKRLRRIGAYGLLLRELREVLSIRSRHPDASLPLPRVLGCVATSCGMGLLVRAELGRDGRPAPTLAQAVRRADAAALDLPATIDRFCEELLRFEVIVSNARPANILLLDAGTPAQRLQLVEGFGEKNFIPRCSLSRRFNAANTRRRIAKVRSWVTRHLDQMAAQTPALPNQQVA